jgi:TrmH family RNA methyltransferase
VGEAITSTANSEVKRLVRLQRAAGRREQAVFLVEGLRAIDGFLVAGQVPRCLYLREDLEPPASWNQLPLRLVSRAVAERVSTQRSVSGYLAEFPLPASAELEPSRGGLVLAGVADPGNMGTLLRSAAAFGLAQVALLGGADPWAPKVVQASAGALASLRLQRSEGEDPALLAALVAGAPGCALVVSGGQAAALPPPPLWMVVGSEAHGLGPELLAHCTHRLTLPMPGGGESLNAGVAGSIACFLAQGLHR